MLTTIGVILTVVGALTVVVIVMRAAPRLARLPASLPVESTATRELRVKERLLLERLTRRMRAVGTRVHRTTSSTFRRWESSLQRVARRLRLLAQSYVAPRTAPAAQTCDAYLASATAAIDREALEEAEDHYLACLKIEPKHRGAYLGLAQLYQTRREQGLAEETLRFLRKLYPEDIEVRVQLAMVLRDREKYGAALDELAAALASEPRNPKYLDFATELAIMDRKPRTAKRYLEQLRQANPENQKLEEFEERVRELSSLS